MIRAPFGDQSYWDKWIGFIGQAMKERLERLKKPSRNPRYRPQYLYELSQQNYEQILRHYSAGNDVSELTKYFLPLIAAWEESERLGREVWTDEQQYTRHAWAVNLDHYIVCFWLIGLALVFEVPDDQWQRLVALVGNEGNDILLDQIIATRQPGRKIGNKLCHPKPYQHLLDALNAPSEQQAKLLAAFVENWYMELNRLPKNKSLSEDTMIYERPYWYKYGEKNMAGGAYFGQWCIEAVAAVKAFGIDDSLCLGHPHYPGDLLRPGQTTSPDMRRLPKPLEEWMNNQKTEPLKTSLTGSSESLQKLGWLQKFFNKR